MNYKMSSGIMLVFLLSIIPAPAFNLQLVSGESATIVVPNDYPTIQEAVNAASPGDIILVKSGVYYENVLVNKGVSLIGEDSRTTIIDARWMWHGIMVEANGVAIANFTIRRGYGAGIYLSYVQDCNISNNVITDNDYGLWLDDSSSNSIYRNSIEGNLYWSIWSVDSSNNTIYGNNIDELVYLAGSSNNKIWHNNLKGGYITLAGSNNNSIRWNSVTESSHGITIWDSCNNLLRDNSFVECYYSLGVFGTSLSHYIHDIDTSNTVNGKPVHYLINQHGLVINATTYPSVGWLALINSTDMIVEGLELTGGFQGILFAYTINSRIENNIVRSNTYGIYLDKSLNNVIYGNKVILCHSYGILLSNSSNNSIYKNIVQGTYKGIELYGSSNNKIWHNNFINNTIQVIIDRDSINVWDDDYPSGGNYWNDYKGLDHYSGPYPNKTGSDGIGDMPYIMDVDNVDRYPLMEPYWYPHDVGVTGIASKSIVGQGFTICIDIVIENYGNHTETFNVTVYVNAIPIGTQAITLESGNSTTFAFTWDTTDFSKGNYVISAYVSPVLDEMYTVDNTFTNGWVIVAMVGDITGPEGLPDGKVDIRDISTAASAFGSSPSHPRWNPIADIDNDYKVDIKDIARIAGQFGKTSQ